MKSAYTYILKCSNGTYYTGSTKDISRRLKQHEAGEGANYTRKHLPVELVYLAVFNRIDHAFYREQQIKNWSQKKKGALIQGDLNQLKEFAKAKNQ